MPYTWFGKELGEHHLLRLTAVLRDEDSSYMYLVQEEISICEPPLTIEVRLGCLSATAVGRKQFS